MSESLRFRVAKACGWHIEWNTMQGFSLKCEGYAERNCVFTPSQIMLFSEKEMSEQLWQLAPEYDTDLNAIIPLCKSLRGFSLMWDDYSNRWEAVCEIPSKYKNLYGEWEGIGAEGDDPAIVCCELYVRAKE